MPTWGGAGAHALSARPPALQRAGVCALRGQGRSPRCLGRCRRPSALVTLGPSAPVSTWTTLPHVPLHLPRLRPVSVRGVWAGETRRATAGVQRSFTPKASALWPPRGRAHRAAPLLAFLVWSRVSPARWLHCEDGRSQCGRRVGPEPQWPGPATLRRTAPPRGDLQAGGAGAEHHLPGWPVRHGALGSVM